MSAASNYAHVSDVNPILVRALEAEMREAEKRVEGVLGWDVARLNSDIAGQPVGEGPHLERAAAATALIRDAVANYLAVKAELDHARNPQPLDPPVASSVTWTILANDKPQTTETDPTPTAPKKRTSTSRPCPRSTRGKKGAPK